MNSLLACKTSLRLSNAVAGTPLLGMPLLSFLLLSLHSSPSKISSSLWEAFSGGHSAGASPQRKLSTNPSAVLDHTASGLWPPHTAVPHAMYMPGYSSQTLNWGGDSTKSLHTPRTLQGIADTWRRWGQCGALRAWAPRDKASSNSACFLQNSRETQSSVYSQSRGKSGEQFIIFPLSANHIIKP